MMGTRLGVVVASRPGGPSSQSSAAPVVSEVPVALGHPQVAAPQPHCRAGLLHGDRVTLREGLVGLACPGRTLSIDIRGAVEYRSAMWSPDPMNHGTY